MKTNKTIWLKTISLSLLIGIGAANAQNNSEPYRYQQNTVTEESLMKAISQYDGDVRSDILTATQYPDILQKTAEIRDRTSNAFRNTIQGYPQKKQNWFYEVSRYPDLMDRLASMPRRASRNEIEAELPQSASPELKEAAWKLYDDHQQDLIKVASLNQDAVISFQNLIRPLGPVARNAFQTLEGMPDVLALLNDHIGLTTSLGERYSNDPANVNQQLADLRSQLNDQNRQDQDSYKNELAQDPDAAREMDEASREYASTGGSNFPEPPASNPVNYINPYSYWFGYPSWYGYPMWYPGAYGYGSGIYLGLGMYSSFYGFPSLGFSRWFYGGAYRRYPNLYRRYDYIYRDRIARNRYYSPDRYRAPGVSGRYANPGVSARSRAYGDVQPYRQGRVAPSQGYRSYAPGNYGGRSNGSYSRPSYGGSSSRVYQSPGGGSRGGYGGGGFRGGSGGGARGGRR